MDPHIEITSYPMYDGSFQDIALQTDSKQYYNEQIDPYLGLVPLHATIVFNDEQIFEIFEDFIDFQPYTDSHKYEKIVAEALALEEFDQTDSKSDHTQPASFNEKYEETQCVEIKHDVLDIDDGEPLHSIDLPGKHLSQAPSPNQPTSSDQTLPPSQLDLPNQVKPKKVTKSKTRKKVGDSGSKPPKARMQYQHSNYACEPCVRTFGGQRGLTQHNNVHHSGPREHRCGVCGKRFHTPDDLEKHERRHEALSKPFKCVECPRGFCYQHDLDRHVSFHHGEARFGCQVCGKRVARWDQLIIHETSHANNTVRVRTKKIGADRFLSLG